LHLASEYNFEIQTRIPVSLAALHNFISIHDPREGPILGGGSHHSTDDAEEQEDAVLQGGHEEIHEHNENREQIAEAMWADYQRICQERGRDANDPFDGDVDSDNENEGNLNNEEGNGI
jgi:hypothetical protein